MASASSELSQPYLLGIDEAGRGPVLGPMVYAYAACPIAAKDELAAMGFADSKALNKQQRETLLRRLTDSPLLQQHSLVLSPQQLSADMQRSARVSLNVISHDAAIALIHHAIEQRGLRLAEVYVDTVGEPRSYAAKLEAHFPHLRFTVTAKADSLFPVVSAASIVAKCNRDDALQHWHFAELGTQPPQLSSSQSTELDDGDEDDRLLADSERDEEVEQEANGTRVGRKRYNAALLDERDTKADRDEAQQGRIDREMGSGYPGDPATKRWLARHVDVVFGFPSVVRFSWSTARQLLQARAYAVTWHDALDEEEAADEQDRVDARTQRMEQFMGAASNSDNRGSTGSSIASRERYHYFQHRNLNLLTTLA